jgi:hypothetical protein
LKGLNLYVLDDYQNGVGVHISSNAVQVLLRRTTANMTPSAGRLAIPLYSSSSTLMRRVQSSKETQVGDNDVIGFGHRDDSVLALLSGFLTTGHTGRVADVIAMLIDAPLIAGLT